MKSRKHIKCSAGKVYLRKDGIVAIRYSDNTTLKADNVKELVNTARSLSDQELSILIDHRIPHTFTFDAFASLRQSNTVQKLAFIIKKGINEKIAQVYKRGNLPFLVELFHDENEAVSWLR